MIVGVLSGIPHRHFTLSIRRIAGFPQIESLHIPCQIGEGREKHLPVAESGMARCNKLYTDASSPKRESYFGGFTSEWGGLRPPTPPCSTLIPESAIVGKMFIPSIRA